MPSRDDGTVGPRRETRSWGIGTELLQTAVAEATVPRPRPSRPLARRDAARAADCRAMRALLDYRSEFPILEHTTYLINHSLGAMPAAAEERLAEYARTWRERGHPGLGGGLVEPAADRRRPGRPHRRRAARLDRDAPERRDRRGGRPLVLPPADRSATGSSTNEATSRRFATSTRRSPTSTSSSARPTRRSSTRIDERTLLVPISHVLFKSGEIQDVAPIIRRAHEVGAHVILDAYQSAGIVPLDVTALGVDFAVGGSVKWLCGGPGNGWLYVRPDLAERLAPDVTGWQAHESPFAFEEEMRYAAGAARFLTGTPNVPAHYAATAGYDLIEEIGVERIRENSLRQTSS